MFQDIQQKRDIPTRRPLQIQQVDLIATCVWRNLSGCQSQGNPRRIGERNRMKIRCGVFRQVPHPPTAAPAEIDRLWLAARAAQTPSGFASEVQEEAMPSAIPEMARLHGPQPVESIGIVIGLTM